MTLFDLSDEDVKKLASFCFEPQKMVEALDKHKMIRAKDYCPHATAERVQLGTVDDPQFAHLTVGYRCVDCNELVTPIISGYATKKT